jgi:hypothetical protein
VRPAPDFDDVAVLSPADAIPPGLLAGLTWDGVQSDWHRALERKTADPEGAITAARTLLETVCKHILDEAHEAYENDGDLPKLYKKAASQMNLGPSQHTEQIFKQIVSGCQSVVLGLGALRNQVGDAHGQGTRQEGRRGRQERALRREADGAPLGHGRAAYIRGRRALRRQRRGGHRTLTGRRSRPHATGPSSICTGGHRRHHPLLATARQTFELRPCNGDLQPNLKCRKHLAARQTYPAAAGCRHRRL